MSNEPANTPSSLDKDMGTVIDLLTSIDNHLRSMSGIPSLAEETPGAPDQRQ